MAGASVDSVENQSKNICMYLRHRYGIECKYSIFLQYNNNINMQYHNNNNNTIGAEGRYGRLDISGGGGVVIIIPRDEFRV